MEIFTVKVCMSRPGAGSMAISKSVLLAALLGGGVGTPFLLAQAPAAPATSPSGRALGTVKSVTGSTVALTTDAGQSLTVTLGSGVRVQQLAPGSTDLKTAEASSADAITVGDRVLVSGTPGDTGTLTATRVILMKSSAIAQRNQSSQADWIRRGSGGIVTAVDPATKDISISSGTRKVTVDTTGSTIFRRYAPGSVKFEEAKPGTLAQIQPGDQLRVRGEKSGDGSTITAEEIVSGAFKNLSGTIVSMNPATNSLVIKDLTTKKNETVDVTGDSDLRMLPPEMAARFAARRGAGAAGGTTAAAASGTTASATGSAPQATAGGRPTGEGAAAGAGYAGRGGREAGSGGPGAGGSRAGGDLSQMIPRLPKITLSELKPGEALMIVASGNGGGDYTAITLLGGVEPLLTGPAGRDISISPWSLGSGGAGAEGGEAQ